MKHALTALLLVMAALANLTAATEMQVGVGNFPPQVGGVSEAQNSGLLEITPTPTPTPPAQGGIIELPFGG